MIGGLRAPTMAQLRTALCPTVAAVMITLCSSGRLSWITSAIKRISILVSRSFSNINYYKIYEYEWFWLWIWITEKKAFSKMKKRVNCFQLKVGMIFQFSWLTSVLMRQWTINREMSIKRRVTLSMADCTWKRNKLFSHQFHMYCVILIEIKMMLLIVWWICSVGEMRSLLASFREQLHSYMGKLHH